jgi:hypothetical protein
LRSPVFTSTRHRRASTPDWRTCCAISDRPSGDQSIGSQIPPASIRMRAVFGSDGCMIQRSRSLPLRSVESYAIHLPWRAHTGPSVIGGTEYRDLPSVISVVVPAATSYLYRL